MKLMIVLTIFLMGQNTFAFDKEDSFGELQEALMQSNKDYNTTKKLELQEDNRRIASWNGSEPTMIVIPSGIETETKEYRPLN